MKAKLIEFGQIEIDGERYDFDLVIENGVVRKRRKKASKVYRERYDHTPLSVAEDIPWNGKRLIIGMGIEGKLPIMPEVYKEAERRGVEIVAVRTEDACLLLRRAGKEVNAILHVTC